MCGPGGNTGHTFSTLSDGEILRWCDGEIMQWCDSAMVRWLLNSFSEANSAADISPPTNNLGKRSDDLRNSFLVGLCCSQ